MGINVKHLLDRPCSVCEFHKENGCCKWSCVFEQEPILDKIRAELERWHKEGTNWSDIRLMEIENIVNEVQGRK